jgi:hypothetical protein
LSLKLGTTCLVYLLMGIASLLILTASCVVLGAVK